MPAPKKNRNNFRHGRSRSSIYVIWSGMKARCNCPTNAGFKDYGARGITVCDRWIGKDGFQHFWEDMGERPFGKTLERKNNNLGYSKENCVWADDITQANNTRKNRLLMHEGVTQTLAQWARQYGLSYQTLYSRLMLNWLISDALTTPKMAIGKGALNYGMRAT